VTIVAITEAVTVAGWESTPSGHDLAAAGPALGYIVIFGAVIAVLSWNTVASLAAVTLLNRASAPSPAAARVERRLVPATSRA
jgi:hypothetical protein